MQRSSQFFLVWIALLSLLALTLGASFVLTGPPSLIAGLVIATIKVSLVFWFFMQLNHETWFHRLSAIGAIAWLVILVTLSLTDYITR
jgi:cytochrome c oxidase subunit 4